MSNIYAKISVYEIKIGTLNVPLIFHQQIMVMKDSQGELVTTITQIHLFRWHKPFAWNIIPFTPIIIPFARIIIPFARIIIPFAWKMIPFARIIISSAQVITCAHGISISK